MTQKDIAKILGISPATVSLALRNSEKVNQETKEKVKKIADEFNYRPCEIARSLVLKKTWTVGLIIPSFSVTYYFEFSNQIYKKLKENNYLTITLPANTFEERKVVIDSFLRRKVDGLILGKISYSELYWLKREKIPFVLYDKIEDEVDYV